MIFWAQQVTFFTLKVHICRITESLFQSFFLGISSACVYQNLTSSRNSTQLTIFVFLLKGLAAPSGLSKAHQYRSFIYHSLGCSEWTCFVRPPAKAHSIKRKEPREKGDNNKQFTLSCCAGDKFAFVFLFWPKKNNNSKVLFARARIMACDKKQAATNANRQMDLSLLHLHPAALSHIHTQGSFSWVRTFASPEPKARVWERIRKKAV